MATVAGCMSNGFDSLGVRVRLSGAPGWHEDIPKGEQSDAVGSPERSATSPDAVIAGSATFQKRGIFARGTYDSAVICRCKSVARCRREQNASRLDSGHRHQRQGRTLLCGREQATPTKNDNASGKRVLRGNHSGNCPIDTSFLFLPFPSGSALVFPGRFPIDIARCAYYIVYASGFVVVPAGVHLVPHRFGGGAFLYARVVIELDRPFETAPLLGQFFYFSNFLPPQNHNLTGRLR